MWRYFAVFTLLVASSLRAQILPAPHSVRASGEVFVSASPDRAEVEVGVVTRAATAQEAASQNASQTAGS